MKNYTSTVPVEVTIGRIEKILMKAKVRNVMKDYDDGNLVALYFTLKNPTTDSDIAVRMPANVQAVMTVLRGDRFLTAEGKRRMWAQANRTAWKLMQDWLQVQLSLIEMGQAKTLEVFMPYFWSLDQRKSYFELALSDGFRGLLLPPGPKED